MIKLRHVNFVYRSESSELLASAHLGGDSASPKLAANEPSSVSTSAAPFEQSGSAAAFDREAGDADGRLVDVSLEVGKGQFVLITGPSGCGKSTVLRLINGLIPHFYPGDLSGEVLVDGVNVSTQELYDIGRVVGTVFQNPRSQFFNVDTDSELAFACENQGMDPVLIRERMESTIERFGVRSLMGRSIFRLSGGEKQKIACASIDVGKPQVILLDEPSANLDFESTMRLRGLISLWKDAGCTIVVAEHRISYLWDLIDRAIIMQGGRIVEDLDTPESRQLSPAQLSQRSLRSTVVQAPSEVDLPSTREDEDAFVLRDFRFSYRMSPFARKAERNRQSGEANIDFSDVRIASGLVTAVVGPNGSGKTTLLNCLCGLERRCKGWVEYRGERFGRHDLQDKVFMVMQDTNHQLFTESVLEELLITMESSGMQASEEEALAVLDRVDLRSFAKRHPMSLSGGQKQRLAVACALASGSDILLFDEPTSGLDYTHMQQTAQLVRSVKEQGKTIVVVTHDSEFIQSCCDRILVVSEGRLV